MIISLQEEVPTIEGRLAGTDEAGRGPLAGNVVAAAVILDPVQPIEGLDDSKRLTAKRRELLYQHILQQALCCAVVSVSPQQIDEMNILQASLHAMRLAVEQLDPRPDHVFVDGNKLIPGCRCACTAIIKGDSRITEISAASILAKVERDRQMLKLHEQYPQYGFDGHKGYPTRAHFAALEEHGPCPEHRRSFGPVQRVLELDSPG